MGTADKSEHENGDEKEFSYEMYSNKSTHAVTPLDLLTCRPLADPAKCKAVYNSFGITLQEGGAALLVNLGGPYRGLTPLWGRQVMMMKFRSFEKIHESYDNVVPKPLEPLLSALTKPLLSALIKPLTKWEHLIVTFTACSIASVLCAIVLHPSKTLISKLSNNHPSRSIGGNWREFAARIVMIGTLTGLQLFAYDAFKEYVRAHAGVPQTEARSEEVV